MPEVFGRAIALSPASYVEHEGKPAWLLDMLRQAPAMPRRVDVSAGLLEDLLLPGARGTAEVLRDRGVEVNYVEFSGSHDVAGWLPELCDALAVDA
jgi:enterochelin esterase-like enzyme